MLQEKDLIKTFQLNYGAWHLLDNEFLELYKHLFLFDRDRKPIFELSPEVFNDEARKKIKNQSVAYSIQELEENTSLIHRSLEDNVKVSIFFSRYHDCFETYSEKKKEIADASFTCSMNYSFTICQTQECITTTCPLI